VERGFQVGEILNVARSPLKRTIGRLRKLENCRVN
jgi:hypothetical protein